MRAVLENDGENRMTELKTLKDIEFYQKGDLNGSGKINKTFIETNLKKEALKWLKAIRADEIYDSGSYQRKINREACTFFIQQFFNLTREETDDGNITCRYCGSKTTRMLICYNPKCLMGEIK